MGDPLPKMYCRKSLWMEVGRSKMTNIEARIYKDLYTFSFRKVISGH